MFSAILATAALLLQEGEAVFRSDSKLVELHATVIGADGKPVKGLDRSAFQVRENDVEQQIKVFRQEDAPVSLGLVIDSSASMTHRRSSVAAAALTLVRESNPDDEEFIVKFNEKTTVVQDFTSDPVQLDKALAAFESSGLTALRDAVSVGVAHLQRAAKHEKKVLLVVSDGEDNSSMTTLANVTRDAQKAGVIIYAIGLLGDANEREAARARRDLDTLTGATGGQVFYPKELSEVDLIAGLVAHELRNQYTIAYSPSDVSHDGKYRTLQVTVHSPAGATVKTRAGYFQ